MDETRGVITSPLSWALSAFASTYFPNWDLLLSWEGNTAGGVAASDWSGVNGPRGIAACVEENPGDQRAGLRQLEKAATGCDGLRRSWWWLSGKALRVRLRRAQLRRGSMPASGFRSWTLPRAGIDSARRSSPDRFFCPLPWNACSPAVPATPGSLGTGRRFSR